jgi:hypothetical protein
MEALMKDNLLFWLEQIAATVLFFGAMALIYVVMVLVFHDPLLWQ